MCRLSPRALLFYSLVALAIVHDSVERAVTLLRRSGRS
jgi:hypothetical protein